MLAAPHEETWKIVEFSAQRLKKKENEQKAEDLEGYQEVHF